jgi:hypothetical protein
LAEFRFVREHVLMESSQHVSDKASRAATALRNDAPRRRVKNAHRATFAQALPLTELSGAVHFPARSFTVTLQPWWFGGGLLVAASLWAGSSVAVDPSESPAKLPRHAEHRVRATPIAAPSSSVSKNRRPTAVPQYQRRGSPDQQWMERGGWQAIEKQIRKPVEQPAARVAIEADRLRLPSADAVEPTDETAQPMSEPATDATGPLVGPQTSEGGPAVSQSTSEFSSELLELRTKIRSVLAHYQTRQLNTRDHSAWDVMHAIVAYNVRTDIRRDGPSGPPVNAVGWLLWGGRCRGQQMVTLSRGRPYVTEGVGVQGHPAQLLAILAQSRVSVDTPMRIDGKDFVLQDLIDEEKLNCRADSELTFKLISFAHYLKSDATWRSRDGQSWSIPRIINAEIKAPIRGAPCGGTHRLFGITYSYQTREKEGRPVDGEFLRAKQYIESYQKYTWSLANEDGSFSTEWFARRGNRPDIDRKIQTSGHILEWLAFSLSDEQLREPRTIKSVKFIVDSLAREPNRSWSIGPMGHALHALQIYDERVFGGAESAQGSGTLALRSPHEDAAETSDEQSSEAADEAEPPALSSEIPADDSAAFGPSQGPALLGIGTGGDQ